MPYELHMSFKDVPITTVSSDKSKPKWFADPDARHTWGRLNQTTRRRVPPHPLKDHKDRKECVRIKAVP